MYHSKTTLTEKVQDGSGGSTQAASYKFEKIDLGELNIGYRYYGEDGYGYYSEDKKMEKRAAVRRILTNN
ncbi:MAG: hypothetical protein WCL00_00560 [Bacteroidota bacterium]